MSDMSVFDQQIRDRLAMAERARAEALGQLASEMEWRESSLAAFEKMAGPIHARVIMPAIERLAQHLTGSVVEHYRTGQGFFSTCRVDRTEAYPAFGSVTVGLERAVDGPRTFATCRMSIIPMLFSFEPAAELALPVDPAEDVIAEWVAARLLDFLESYLRVGLEPGYQRDVIRKDPVCGMMVAASLLPYREQVGKRIYYFCSTECLQRFAADPTLYTTERVAVTGRAGPAS